MKNKKIVIIGAGNVGSHIVSASIARNIKAEFILVDTNDNFEKAQAEDLKDAASCVTRTQVTTGDLSDVDVQSGDIFVITAGVKQKEGETRMNLVDSNRRLLTKIASQLTGIKKTSLVILVSNPVDILTQKAQELFDLPKGQVFGTGTSLDSARLRWRIGEKFRICCDDAFVLGEHGDSSFIYWSGISNTKNLTDSEKTDMEDSVRSAANNIIKGKGAIYFGIGAVTADILQSIINNTKKIYALSVPLHGEYEQSGVSIGVMAKVSKKGIIKVIEKKLSDEEKEKFNTSVEQLRKNMN